MLPKATTVPSSFKAMVALLLPAAAISFTFERGVASLSTIIVAGRRLPLTLLSSV